MKIAFINDGAYAYASAAPVAVGGSERDQWLLGTALASFGWSVTMAVRNGMELGERRSIRGVEYVGIGQGQVLSAWYRFLAAERPQWLYWECATHLWGLMVEVAKSVGVRTIFAIGFDREVEIRNALTERPKWWPLYAWGLSRTDWIFAQHQGQLSKLPPRWRSKASVLPKVCVLPGVVGDTVAVRSHSERDKYVAWVAMLRQHKRPDVLVEIARRMPHVRFVVCGGPSTLPLDSTERIIEQLRVLPNVEYLRQVPSEKAQQVIANAAILLSTSDEEGFPNTFVQAWSAGTPIITIKVDPDQIIERVGLGLVSCTVERAITDIDDLMDSPRRRDEIGAHARAFIVENYGARAVVNSFEKALVNHSRA
jgi:glycosyltransferase involved in cell wall biosynthesis